MTEQGPRDPREQYANWKVPGSGKKGGEEDSTLGIIEGIEEISPEEAERLVTAAEYNKEVKDLKESIPQNKGEKEFIPEKSKAIGIESSPNGKKFKRGDGTEVSVLLDKESNKVSIAVIEKGKPLPVREVELRSDERPIAISENKSGGIRFEGEWGTNVEVHLREDGTIFVAERDKHDPNAGLHGTKY